LSVIDNTSLRGIIFDIRKYSVHDGPGIRTTVFFKGCPLRCMWCHNPEGLDPAVEITFRDDRCIRCGSCQAICEQEAISWMNNAPVTFSDLCIRCGDCTEVCYAEARETVGKEMSVDQVMAEIESDMAFYDESGGGVTLSGGEPFLQAVFAQSILERCKNKGIHTVVDTCGFAMWEDLEKISGYTDLFLFDLKFLDDEKHREYTGVSNEVILTNLSKLSRPGNAIVIRLPLIPGINDDDDHIHSLGAHAASLQNIQGIELLPYHELGTHKYIRFSKENTLPDIQSPSRERVEEIKNILTGFGLTVLLKE